MKQYLTEWCTVSQDTIIIEYISDINLLDKNYNNDNNLTAQNQDSNISKPYLTREDC